MTNDAKNPSADPQWQRLTPDQARLSRVRAAVACERYDEAVPLVAELVQSQDPAIEVRAKLQLALLHHQRREHAIAVGVLSEAAHIVDTQRVVHDDRRALRNEDPLREAPPGSDRARNAHRELQLELARTWARVGQIVDAKSAYLTLLREGGISDARSVQERHVAALAEYRLAELLVDDEPDEAIDRWMRVVAAGDERISPHAALRMATRIGSEHLVTGRVEKLFHHAMGSSDPELSSDAALGLARHLMRHRLFGEASRYFEMVIANASDDACVNTAQSELKSLRLAEKTASIKDHLGRSQRLRAKLQSEFARLQSKGNCVIVVGAGTGGDYLLESLDPERYTVIGFVDDHAVEVGGYPQYRILGSIDHLAAIIREQKPDEVLLAIPTLRGVRRRDVVNACRETSTPLRNLPRMHELGIGWKLSVNRRRLMTQLRPVEIEEMIGNKRVEIDRDATDWLQYRCALVVGAGALGAEICRRLVDGDIGRLVLVDRRQSALDKVEDNLTDTREFRSFDPVVGDASDRAYLARVFRHYAPMAVFNTTGRRSARALEPDRFMRDPEGWETVARNEMLAASAVAQAAVDAKVPRMVHVSSRRAGRPNDLFGSMKALVEEIVLLHAARQDHTLHTVVRVGPLLDSPNGRLSRLKGQIKNGIAVTIPGPNATVRFLSTARWAELVLHAARIATMGELLEPDTGDDVALRDIAEQAIRLQGWYPGDDILIESDEDDDWDEPATPGSRVPRGADELGIFALPRPMASMETLDAAMRAFVSVIKDHDDLHVPDWATKEVIRDIVEASEPSLELLGQD